MSTVTNLIRAVGVGACRLAVWSWWHRRWSGWIGLAAMVTLVLGQRTAGLALLAVWLVPGVVAVVWCAASPVGHERWCAGPARRRSWRRWAKKNWHSLSRECGLSVLRTPKQGLASELLGRPEPEAQWFGPRLMNVSTDGACMTLLVRARVGQTPDDVAAAVPAIAAAAEAHSHRVRQLSPSVVEMVLVMGDLLAAAAQAVAPRQTSVASVRLGRSQDGGDFGLRLIGRQTLVVGCSGSGKGSYLWGVAGGLAPAISADTVRLWGIDLKGGVEVAMGRPLFVATAYEHQDARAVLRRLLDVIEARTAVMRGQSRLHQPRPGDPLHVLVIDELAALTAYEPDSKARDEATRLLGRVLTQGRAVGVIVVAFVQDPTKKTVEFRNLFTQTVALRLRSADETRMVLGDGMAAIAPAHKISPAAPGTGWIVQEDGTADRVRADWWQDDLVRKVAGAYSAPVAEDLDDARVGLSSADTDAAKPTGADLDSGENSRAQRKPRSPRKPRGPRSGEAA